MLQIQKGGRLIQDEWDGDLGEYKQIDVTSHGIRHLFDSCTLADDVLLRDILLFLHNDVDIYDAVLGNWLKELVEEGLNGPPKKYEYGQENIEYLELSFTPELQRNLVESPPETLTGIAFPDLNGVGWKLKTDLDYGHGNIHKAGERIPWGISLTPVNELADIPVRLSNTMKITLCDYSDKANRADWWKEVAKYENPEYTLGQILYAIVWELSWHGGPEKRDKFGDELKDTVKELKDGQDNC